MKLALAGWAMLSAAASVAGCQPSSPPARQAPFGHLVTDGTGESADSLAARINGRPLIALTRPAATQAEAPTARALRGFIEAAVARANAKAAELDGKTFVELNVTVRQRFARADDVKPVPTPPPGKVVWIPRGPKFFGTGFGYPRRALPTIQVPGTATEVNGPLAARAARSMRDTDTKVAVGTLSVKAVFNPRLQHWEFREVRWKDVWHPAGIGRPDRGAGVYTSVATQPDE